MRVQLQDLRLFNALPSPHLLLDVDLVIVQVNPAYARLVGLVGLGARELIGRCVFDAFPPRAQALGQDGVPRLQRSFERVIATGAADVLPAERYPLIDLRTGQVHERWWSSTTVPVLDGEGRVELLIQRVEDITDYLADREQRRRQHDRRQRAEEQWHARALVAETELFARAREVQAVREAERTRAGEVAALAAVTVRVAGAEDVAELIEVLLEHGLSALGAQGGAVAVRESDLVRVAISASLGRQAQVDYAQLPLDSCVPAVLSALSGQRVLLPDRAASLAHDREHEHERDHGHERDHELDRGPSMAEVMDATGCQAWAVLPLNADSAVLGSLVVAWHDAQTFTPAALGVLEAFAGQCAQALARLQARSRAQQARQAEAAQVAELAQALQRALLSEPAHPGELEVITRYRPAAQHAQVGGDWYDSFATCTAGTTLVVGDVCGHDREAAAAMGQLRNLLRGIAYTNPASPCGVLKLLDQALRGLHVQALASTVVVSIEQDGEQDGEHPGPARPGPAVHRLRWSNAGHPPPLLIHPDGRTELLRTEAELLLGVDADSPRSDHEVDVAPGSVLLLYTDGLVERRGADLDDGLAWLARTARALAGAGLGPEQVCDALLEQVDGHADDDVVLLAVRV